MQNLTPPISLGDPAAALIDRARRLRPAALKNAARVALTMLVVNVLPALAAPPKLEKLDGAASGELFNAFWDAGSTMLSTLSTLLGAGLLIGTLVVVGGKYMEVSGRNGSLAEIVPTAGVGLAVLLLGGLLLTLGWDVLSGGYTGALPTGVGSSGP